MQPFGEKMEIWKDLSKSKLFNGLDEASIKALNFCFKSRLKFVNKNEIIVSAGEKNEYCVYILKGSAKGVLYDEKGTESILEEYKTGDIYGLTEAYAKCEEYTNTLVAKEKSTIILFNRYRFIHPCENRCPRHTILVKHLSQILAQNNINLYNKISILSKRTIRDKILAYLNLININNEPYFDIPLNRQELANFLAVDRSALSKELSNLKQEGIIDFNKNHFSIKK